MRILLVFNQHRIDYIKNILLRNNVAERENVIAVSNFEKAREFINNELILQKGHIDLIVTGYRLANNDYDIHLADWKKSNQANYSADNFKIKAIPIILFDEEIRSSDEFYRSVYNSPFDAIADFSNSNNQPEFIGKIKSVVKSFRSKVFDDIDLLKMDYKLLQVPLYRNLDLYYHLKIKAESSYWVSLTGVLLIG